MQPRSLVRIRRLVILALAGLLTACGGSSGGGGGAPAGDLQEPLFGGLVSIATAGGTAVRLDWKAAEDNITAAGAITYRVYGSATSGGQNFGAPILTSAAGATSAIFDGGTAPFLAVGAPAYFVVRARDGAGNEDENVTELCVTPVSGSAVAFVSSTAGGAGTLGDPTDPFATIQLGVDAVEANGIGIVLVDAALGGTSYNAEVDATVAVTHLGIYGSFARFSTLPVGPSGAAILATRNLVANPVTISGSGLLPFSDDDLVRITNASPTNVDGLRFDGCQTLTPLTGAVSFYKDTQRVRGEGTIFNTEVGLGFGSDLYVQLDADGIPMEVNLVESDTELVFDVKYQGVGGTGPGSLVTVDDPALRVIDADLQMSCCLLAGGSWCMASTTAITVPARLRLVGLATEGEWNETFVVEGGLALLHAQNNDIFRRGSFVETDDEVTETEINAATTGLTMLITSNLFDDNRVSNSDGWIDLQIQPASPATGGPLRIVIAHNEARNNSGDAFDFDGFHEIGDGGSVDIQVYGNLGNGQSSSFIDADAFDFNSSDNPPAGVPVTFRAYDNELVNGNGDPIEVEACVSAGQTTHLEARDNFLSVSESETIEFDDVAGDDDNVSDGGTYRIHIIRNIHYSGGEEFSAEFGVAHNGLTLIEFRENTVLGTEEPCIECAAERRLGTTTGSYGFPNGVWCANIFNNDLTANDDHVIEIEDVRDSDGAATDGSAGLLYVGHNVCRHGSDPFRGAIYTRYAADNLNAVIERNVAGFAGDDNGDPAMDFDTDSDALANHVLARNNVAAVAAGGGFEFQGNGAPPQLINNTVAYCGLDGEYAFEQSDGFNGFDQTFILNCIASHNAANVERVDGVTAFYSLIDDEPSPFGFGNISGAPQYAKDPSDLPLVGLKNEDLRDLFTLLPSSPAIDAGHPGSRYNDPDGTRNDMGAYGGPAAGPLGWAGAGVAQPFVYLGTAPAVHLYTGARLPPDGSTLYFGFTRPVDAGSLAAGISITSGGLNVPGALQTIAGGHLVRFVPAGSLTPGASPFVDVAFSTALRDTSGQALRAADRTRFAVEPAQGGEAEPNDDGAPGVSLADLAAANPLGIGPGAGVFRLGATLGAPGDEDVFSFTAAAGARLMATVLDARLGGSVGANHIDLYDANGNLIDLGRRDLWNQDFAFPNGDSYVDHVFATSGTYYLVVTATDGFYELQGVLD